MPQETFIEKQEENISIHIFTVSSAMVGVCITVIGILNIVSCSRKIETWGDEITALDAIIFLITAILAYFALKTRNRKRRLALEKTADTTFLSGLVLMVVVCVFIALKVF